MGSLKQLAGQTVIYGVSSIVGRLLNYLLVPLYTNIFVPAEYGVVTELYAYVGFLVVLLTYGMETAFFRFSRDSVDKEKVYSTSLWSLLVTSILFLGLAFIFTGPISNALEYIDHPEYIRWFALILAFDALVSIPFAKLRADNRAIKFATLRFIWIFVNIGLNLFFLLLSPKLYQANPTGIISYIYNPEIGVGYIFISNLAASALIFLLLLPQLNFLRLGFDKVIWKKMTKYAVPLAVVGFAGIINEMLDRVLLKRLLPFTLIENMALIGIYGAVYKLSILMSLFNQAFRYAAEPFFFKHSTQDNATLIYARVLNYFSMFGVLIFLFIMLYIDVVKYFIGTEYHSGLHVVPVLLLANLFLGIQINISIWFKLLDKTKIGALISILGAVITIVLNVLWIPKFGYVGSAWATLICYGSMVSITYLIGQRFYPIPYPIKKIGAYIACGLLIYLANSLLVDHFNIEIGGFKYLFNSLFLISYLLMVYVLNRKTFSIDFENA